MGKGGKSKRNKSKKAKQQNKQRQTRLKHATEVKTEISIRGMLARTFGLLIALTGIISFLFVVYPRISAYPGEIVHPYRPFENPIIVKNDGYIAITDIEYFLELEEAFIANQTFSDFTSIGKHDQIPELGPNKTTPLSMKKDIRAPSNLVTSAIIKLNLSYQSKYLPFKTFSNIYRFKLKKNIYGKFFWIESYNISN